MAHQGIAETGVGKRIFKATYHKSQKYDACPNCHSTKCVNYINQIQREMRQYTCARCMHIFFTWGPKIVKPRQLRDMHGRVIRFIDEMGD